MKQLFLYLALIISSITIGQNQNLSNGFVFDGEPYIAVNPQNSQHLVVAWLGYKLNQLIAIKTRISTDGGATWSPIVSIPHVVSGNQSADPSLQFDHLGNVYLAFIDYNANTFSNGAVQVVKSTDGGLSWGTPAEVINITDCPNKFCIDRPWMEINRIAGPTQGSIYVTTMNADHNVSAPYNPYLSVSTDGGVSFQNPRYLDTTNYLSGNSIPQPMASPAIGADGTFYAAYPSYVTSQSLYATIIMASSTNGGTALSHDFIAYGGTGTAVTDPYAKKASYFFADESNANHLAMAILAEYNGDADVFFMESFDKGATWSSLERVNQDPISNGILQDLIWADFNANGDLAITWRDRRSSGNSGYNQSTQIFSAVRLKDSTTFHEMILSDQVVQHDTVLTGKGNDFMCVQLVADTLYAVWGDVRTSKLNIFMSKTNINDAYSSITEVYEESFINAYPNPTSNKIFLQDIKQNTSYNILDAQGRVVKKGIYQNGITVGELPKGFYYLVLEDQEEVLKFVVK